MLFGREVVVGELQFEGDVRPEEHASVEFPGAGRAGCALRLPAVLRRALDLFALSRVGKETRFGETVVLTLTAEVVQTARLAELFAVPAPLRLRSSARPRWR